MNAIPPFHLAIPVHDLSAARSFYGTVLGFPEGRSSEQWIDWNCYGHQLVTHLQPEYEGHKDYNAVDGHAIPIPHFGVVLSPTDWQSLSAKLTAAGITFLIDPYTRFAGQPGEQSTMFFLDPSGNALEFKAFADRNQLFAT